MQLWKTVLSARKWGSDHQISLMLKVTTRGRSGINREYWGSSFNTNLVRLARLCFHIIYDVESPSHESFQTCVEFSLAKGTPLCLSQAVENKLMATEEIFFIEINENIKLHHLCWVIFCSEASSLQICQRNYPCYHILGYVSIVNY